MHKTAVKRTLINIFFDWRITTEIYLHCGGNKNKICLSPDVGGGKNKKL